MKKKIFIITCLAVMISMVLGPLQTVVAATKWPSPGLGTQEEYPVPKAGTFTSVNGVFDKITGSNSSAINVNTDTVGFELNPDKLNNVGAMWSKERMVDLTKAFTLDMQLYFDKNILNAADGIAFALAGTRPVNRGLDSQSIGVWGGAGSGGAEPEDIAAQGLQDSFVVAVDTHKSEMDPDSAYVGSNNQQYLGSGYPGLPGMYNIGPLLYRTKLKFPVSSELKNFADNISINVSNDRWHDLHVSWKPEATGKGGTLNYRFTYSDDSHTKFIDRSIVWTKAQMDKIFGTNVTNVYLGFASATSSLIYSEANLVTIRSLADFIKVNSYVTLKRGEDIVNDKTLLNIGDNLTYNYAIDVDNPDGNVWPIKQLWLPIGEYFEFLRADGTPADAGDILQIPVKVGTAASVNVQAVVQADKRSVVIDNVVQLPKNMRTNVAFNLPVKVKKHQLTSNRVIEDNTGNMTGSTSNTLYKFLNTVGQTDKIKYVLAGNPGAVTLKSVPSFVFKKFVKEGSEDPTNVDPTVGDFIQGFPGQTPFPTTLSGLKLSQWLNTLDSEAPSEGATGKILSVTDTRPNKPGWHLQMSLSPFTLEDGSYVLGDNGNQDGGKAEMVIAENKDGEEKVTEIARVKDDGNTVTVKNMASGGSDWSLGTEAMQTQAFMSIQKTPSVRAGLYRSTVTWTLSDAPMP